MNQEEQLDPLSSDDIAFFRLDRSQAQGWRYLIFSSSLYLAHIMDWTADVIGYRLLGPASPLFVELRLLHLDEDLFDDDPSDPTSLFLPEQEGAGYLALSPHRLMLVVDFLEGLLQESVASLPSAPLFHPLSSEDLKAWRLDPLFFPKDQNGQPSPPIWYRYEPEESVRPLETLPEGVRIVQLPSYGPGKTSYRHGYGDFSLRFTRVYETDLHDPSFKLADSCWGRGTHGFSRAGLRQFVGLLKAGPARA
ncbi:hypothetical protein [Thermogemmatispora sp.]|uniref:hypothetical protein n=1 Tax=Thermogemmatispora sp. TaxID=1968838 RepID=UPI0035E42B0A